MQAVTFTALEIEMEILRMEKEAMDRSDDIAIAREVRQRDLSDTGERMSLAELVESQGFDPADFGLSKCGRRSNYGWQHPPYTYPTSRDFE